MTSKGSRSAIADQHCQELAEIFCDEDLEIQEGKPIERLPVGTG